MNHNKSKAYALRLLFSFGILLTFSSCHNTTQQKETGNKPNILFILVDDLGHSDLGITGSRYYETPNIDGLAEKGTIFTNGYATSAVCSPSRASILTGQFTARHGLTNYDGAKSGQKWKALNRHTKLLPPDFKHHLTHEDTVLPEALKNNGYATFFAGKWHLGSKENQSLPTDHGFDENQGGYEKGGPYSGGYFSPFNNPNMQDHPDEKGMSLSMKLAKETSRFISDNKDQPFLAYLAFYAVHSPIQTTEYKWKKYRNKADSLGIAKVGFEMEHVLPARKYQDNPVYGGLVEQVDDAVGMVLQTLKENGLEENTIVVFTSDNGGVTSGDNYSTKQLHQRGGKGYQWEGGTRVPYFIYVPWLNNSLKIVDVPVTGADFYPTLLDLAGFSLLPEQHTDGVSLKPLFLGGTIDERSLYWHYPHYGNQGGEPNSIIRKGDWKLIYYWEDQYAELYNIVQDPLEQNNAIANNKARAQALEKELMDYLQSMNTHYAQMDPEWNEEERQQWLDEKREVLLPTLEKERLEMLSPDWEPNDDWWGSEID